MLRRLLKLGALVALTLGLVGPAAAALPGAEQARRWRADADTDEQVVARRGRKRRAKKKKATPTPAAAPAAPAPAPAESGGGVMTRRRGPSRVDFDDRLIQGQTNKSGAIYIFERKSSELHSMVRRRTTFREEILRSID